MPYFCLARFRSNKFGSAPKTKKAELLFWESYVGVKCCYKGGNYLTLFGESRPNMLKVEKLASYAAFLFCPLSLK